jgi:hypothetical protein
MAFNTHTQGAGGNGKMGAAVYPSSRVGSMFTASVLTNAHGDVM